MSSTPCKSLKRDGTPLPRQRPRAARRLLYRPRPRRQNIGSGARAAARPRQPPPAPTNAYPTACRHAIDKLSTGIDQVLEGKLAPAALSAISRAAKVLIELYRLADQEMDLIRSEETAAAAAQVAGAAGDPELLDAAAAIAAWQDQYRIERPDRPGPCCARTCRNERQEPTTCPRPDRRRQTTLRLPAADQAHKEGYRRLQRTGDRQPS